MGNNDDKPTDSADPTAKNDLLDELESIKGLLDDSFNDDDLDTAFDIPILDDIVPLTDDVRHDEKTLLDLDHIFDEVDLEAFDTPPESSLNDPASNDFELTDFGLDGLDIDAFNNTIAIPEFTLQAETINSNPASKPAAKSGQLNVTDHMASSLRPTADPDQNVILTDFEHSTQDSSQAIDDEPVTDLLSTNSNTAQLPADSEQLKQLEPTSLSPNIAKTNDIDLGFLIQEIVDEFTPQIEDQLRRRLSTCSADVIKQLAAKHLGK